MNQKADKHGGNVQQEALKMGKEVKDFIDASASIVPFKPPKDLRKFLKKNISNYHIQSYPDRNHSLLKRAISNWHQIDTEMILPGNGASELLTWAAKDAAKSGVSTLPSPGFLDYERALNCWEGKYNHISLPISYKYQKPEEFPLTPNSNVLWITNPHNPTGQLWSKESLEKLLKKYDLIICDEAFLPLVPNGEKESLIPLIYEHSNLIIIRSLTKLFAIPGLRLGYAIGDPSRLRSWREIRDPWPLNGLAIATGTKIMTDTENLQLWINKIQRWVTKEGAWMHKNLAEVTGIRPIPSTTNFILIKGESSLKAIREGLRKALIIVRDCDSFAGLNDSYMRISLQKRSENKRIISLLKEMSKENY